ncbi:hypothetical protein ACP4J5_17380 [Pseudomonas oryzihabitans]|uniref:hypothetical protein n=1 Tax=Pseudomonas oryzihabitans TaxID=47885 RepID=UPI003CEE699C
MLLHNIYWQGDAAKEIKKFVEANPKVNQAAIGHLSHIFAPIWKNSTYVLIEGTDNNIEQKLHSALWKQGSSYKVLKIAGVTALQVGADSLASVEPLLSGLTIAHKGRTAEAALLAVLPLLK